MSDTPPNGNGWPEWRKNVLHRLDEGERREIERERRDAETRETLAEIKTSVAVLTAESSQRRESKTHGVTWGATLVAGAFAVLAVLIARALPPRVAQPPMQMPTATVGPMK